MSGDLASALRAVYKELALELVNQDFPEELVPGVQAAALWLHRKGGAE